MHGSNPIIEHLLNKIRDLPADRVAEVEDFVDFLRMRAAKRQARRGAEHALDFPVDNLGPWPQGLSLRRQDLYGDDER